MTQENGGATSRPELRYFLYLDVPLVREFLAQLEEGEFESYEWEQSAEQAEELSARVGIPGLGGSGATRDRALARATYSMRLTPASQFARLVRLTRSAGWLKEKPVLDDVVRGDLVLISGSVELTGITRLALGLRDLDRSSQYFDRIATPRLASRREALLDLVDERLRRGTKWTGSARSAAKMQGNEIPVIVSVPDQDVRFLVRLHRTHLRVEPTRLAGSARLLLKVNDVLEPGEEREAADFLPGAPGLAESLRLGLESGEDSQRLLGPMTLSYPGFVTTALAVYEP